MIKKKNKAVEIRSTDELNPLIEEEIEDFKENSQKFAEKGVARSAAKARKNTSRLARLFKEYRAATLQEVRDAKEQKKAEEEPVKEVKVKKRIKK